VTVTATAPPAAPAVTESPASDLIERLIAAAAAAILDERQGLAYEPHRLRGIVLELRIDGTGAVIEGTCYLERKTRPMRADARSRAEHEEVLAR